MKKVILTFGLIIGCLIFSKAQPSLNNYKYIIVPNQFGFQQSPNQYQLNDLTTFLFKKYGFNAIHEGGELPADLKSNYCLALNSNVESEGFFKTKTILTLKDCNGKTVFTSKEATTKEKDFKKAHTITIRETFKSLENLNYTYIPSKKTAVQETKSNTVANQEIEKLKEEIKNLKGENSSNKKVVVNTDKKIESAKVVKTDIEKPKETVKVIPKPKEAKQTNVLYAQEIDNGFQVVNSTPKVVMILMMTPKQDVFIVKGRNAVVYKEDGFWYLSETIGKTTTTKTLDIKF